MATQGYHSAHSGTQLGGSPFNHSQSADAEAEFDRLRDLARQEHDKMSSCFERSHQASSSSDPTTAHALSLEAQRHKSSAAALNARASAYIFLQNNPPATTPADTIDLHGQFVEEASDILEARIRDAQARGQDHLHVVVGKGIHSPGHVQKLKLRVEIVCRELGLRYSVEENEGRIYVDLRGAGTAEDRGKAGKWQQQHGGEGGQGQQQPWSQQMPYQQQQGGGGVGGFQGRPAQQGNGGGYQGQQEQQPQYGKPPQQFDQEQQQQQQQDDPLMSCFKKCCIVM